MGCSFRSAWRTASAGLQVHFQLRSVFSFSLPGLIERHDEARLLIEGGKLEEDAVAVQDANVYPTGRVVGKINLQAVVQVLAVLTLFIFFLRPTGVIRRRTRQYCGVLLPPADKSSQRVLFAPKEKTIPNVRIETRQLETLLGQQIVVAIDSWPLKSKFPVVCFHLSFTLGCKRTLFLT